MSSKRRFLNHREERLNKVKTNKIPTNRRKVLGIAIFQDGNVRYESSEKKQRFKVSKANIKMLDVIDMILQTFFATLSQKPPQESKPCDYLHYR